MADFLKMDIFFAVATVSVALIALCMCILLVQLIRFIRTLDSIASEVEAEAQEIRADLDDARASIAREGRRLVPLLGFFGKTALRLSGKKKRKKS